MSDIACSLFICLFGPFIAALASLLCMQFSYHFFLPTWWFVFNTHHCFLSCLCVYFTISSHSLSILDRFFVYLPATLVLSTLLFPVCFSVSWARVPGNVRERNCANADTVETTESAPICFCFLQLWQRLQSSECSLPFSKIVNRCDGKEMRMNELRHLSLCVGCSGIQGDG